MLLHVIVAFYESNYVHAHFYGYYIQTRKEIENTKTYELKSAYQDYDNSDMLKTQRRTQKFCYKLVRILLIYLRFI